MTIAVAGVSARAMAESARRAGMDVISLDCFGDADTRAASRQWIDVAGRAPFEIDAQRFLAALQRLAEDERVQAWMPGAGFEAQPGALAQGEKLLPMAGTAAERVRALRDPKVFFAALDDAGIAHPPVVFAPVGDPAGWLVKDAGGCGGWHVRPADSLRGGSLAPGHYLQREAQGVPMSATFIADGARARVLGINRQHVRRFGHRAHVFRGVVGPVPVPASVAHRVESALQFVTERFALRGLGSLDFLLDGDEVLVLEVNARPPASFTLYESEGEGGSLIAAHLDACREGRLPPLPQAEHHPVRGLEVVYARRALTLDARAAANMAQMPDCHDRPLAGSRFAAGDPLCSLSARGASAQEVETTLAAAAEELLSSLETLA